MLINFFYFNPYIALLFLAPLKCTRGVIFQSKNVQKLRKNLYAFLDSSKKKARLINFQNDLCQYIFIANNEAKCIVLKTLVGSKILVYWIKINIVFNDYCIIIESFILFKFWLICKVDLISFINNLSINYRYNLSMIT